MSFKNGYLGVLVLIIALVATICGSWVLSMDVTEKESTQYNYLTELTGLFSTEQAPTYIEYNPSTNYTGYYTDPETKYFDGVDYTPADQRNQYRLRLAPTESYPEQTVSLADLPTDSGYTLDFFYWTDNGSHSDTNDARHATLSTLITSMQWTELDEITLISTFTSWTDGGFISFYTSEMLDRTFGVIGENRHTLAFKNPELTGDLTINSLVGNTVPAANVLNPVLACKYDKETGYAELYYDIEMEQSLGIYSPQSVFFVWSNSTSSSFHLGQTVGMSGADYPNPIYMDIRQGVKVNG